MSDYSEYIGRIRQKQQEVFASRKALLREQQAILAEVTQFADSLEQSGLILHYQYPGDNPQVPVVTLVLGGSLPKLHISAVITEEAKGLAIFKRQLGAMQQTFQGDDFYQEAFTFLSDTIAEIMGELQFLSES